MVLLRRAVTLAIVVALTGLAACSTDSELVGTWTDSATGQPLPDGSPDAKSLIVVDTYRGSRSCGRNDTVFMDLAWPIGTPVRWDDAEEKVHVYIRNTRGSLLETHGESDLDAELPSEAQATGFERDGHQIFVDPKSQSVYVVGPDGDAERWAMLRTGQGCPS